MREVHSMVAGLDDADMVWLLSVGKLRTVRAGERLVEIDRPLNDLYVVIRGRLAVLTAQGVHVASLREGEVIGEMSFVNQRPPSVSVQAEDASELLMVPRAAILARFDREPVFAARFYRAIAVVLSGRLRDTTASLRAGHDEEEARVTAQRTGERLRSFVAMVTGRRD